MLPHISSAPSADGELLPWCPSASHSGCTNTALATATKPEGIIKGKKQTRLGKENKEKETKNTHAIRNSM